MLSLRFLHAAAALATALSLCAVAPAAQDDGKAPAGAAIAIRIAGLEGEVEVKLPGSKEWIPAKVDMRLGQGAEIQTSLFSWVDLRLANDTTTRLDSVTRMRVDRYLQDATAIRTTLHVRSGTVAAVVNKGKLKSDFRITTPRSTASVRGSELAWLQILPWTMGGDMYLIGPRGLFLIFFLQMQRAMLLGPIQQGYAQGFMLINAILAARFYALVDMLPLGATNFERFRRLANWRFSDQFAGDMRRGGDISGVRGAAFRALLILSGAGEGHSRADYLLDYGGWPGDTDQYPTSGR